MTFGSNCYFRQNIEIKYFEDFGQNLNILGTILKFLVKYHKDFVQISLRYWKNFLKSLVIFLKYLGHNLKDFDSNLVKILKLFSKILLQINTAFYHITPKNTGFFSKIKVGSDAWFGQGVPFRNIGFVSWIPSFHIQILTAAS